jgi:hypothetical protein
MGQQGFEGNTKLFEVVCPIEVSIEVPSADAGTKTLNAVIDISDVSSSGVI